MPLQLSDEELDDILRPLMPKGDLMTKDRAKHLLSGFAAIVASGYDELETRIAETLSLSPDQSVQLRAMIDEKRSAAVETLRETARQAFATH